MNDVDTDTRLAFECAALRLGQNKSEQDMLLYAADFLGEQDMAFIIAHVQGVERLVKEIQREIEWALLPWWKRMFRRRV